MDPRPLILALLLGACALLSPAAASAVGPEPRPDPAIAEWPEWPYRVNCNDTGFDPIAVFSGPAAAERGRRPSERALRRMLAEKYPIPLHRHNWRLARETPGRALFLRGRLGAELESGDELESFELRRHNGRWRMNAYSQLCEPLSVRRGHFATTWFLAKSQPALTPETRRVRVDVGAPCVRGEDVASQAEPPEFIEIGGKLVMTVFLRPSRSRSVICDADVPKGPPLVVDLPGPLGDRELFDGGIFPPSPAVHLPETPGGAIPLRGVWS